MQSGDGEDCGSAAIVDIMKSLKLCGPQAENQLCEQSDQSFKKKLKKNGYDPNLIPKP